MLKHLFHKRSKSNKPEIRLIQYRLRHCRYQCRISVKQT